MAALTTFHFRKLKVTTVTVTSSRPSEIAQSTEVPVFCEEKLMVIFDFDNVLTTQDTLDPLSRLIGFWVPGSSFGGQRRQQVLSTFLGTLAQDANLCIVSRNSSSVIRKALASVDWLRYFVVIYGAEDFDVSVPKSQVIGDLMSLHRKEVDEVLFIDDMFLNVSDVSQHCHVATLHIRTPGGMDVWDCEYILAWARSKKEDLKIPE